MKIDIDGETIVVTVGDAEERLTIRAARLAVSRMSEFIATASDRARDREWAERRAARLAEAKSTMPNGWMSDGKWVGLEGDRYVAAYQLPHHTGFSPPDFRDIPQRALVRMHGARVNHIAEPRRGILCAAQGYRWLAGKDGAPICSACKRIDGQRPPGPLFGEGA